MRIDHGSGLRIGDATETKKEETEKEASLPDVDLNANAKEYNNLIHEINKIIAGTYYDKMTWKDFNKQMIMGINIITRAIKHMKQSYEYYYLTAEGMAEFKKLETMINDILKNIFETER